MMTDKQDQPEPFPPGKAAWAWDVLYQRPELVTVLSPFGEGRYQVLAFGSARPILAAPLYQTAEEAWQVHGKDAEVTR